LLFLLTFALKNGVHWAYMEWVIILSSFYWGGANALTSPATRSGAERSVTPPWDMGEMKSEMDFGLGNISRVSIPSLLLNHLPTALLVFFMQGVKGLVRGVFLPSQPSRSNTGGSLVMVMVMVMVAGQKAV